MQRRRVLLVQLPLPPLGPEPIRGNVPLAAGYLKLFAHGAGLDAHFDIDILPADDANRLGDAALVEEMLRRDPWLVGFTCYLWNIDRTLWVAQNLEARCPELRILLGGPEITGDNGWVLDSASFDYAAVGEGEQTFCDLLRHHAGRGSEPGTIPGLVVRNGGLHRGPRRTPMRDLDAISSPYLAGILNAGDQEQLLLETIRGCVFRCKFCYYPKAYDGLYYVSSRKIAANLEHARENGAREVYLLDPTLNQRRDFLEFLTLLGAGNPDRRLEYYAELRAEGIKPEHARAMRSANFREVEIGLQSIDAATQERMDRRNHLPAFERGVRALQDEGIHVKVDLIVGLPGDSVDSVRRGMHYLAENRLYDGVQVFQLSILPGTAFRHEAAELGLEYQPRPPYYVLATPALSLDDMLGLLEEAEEIFASEFDPLPPPALENVPAGAPGAVSRLEVDLGCAAPAPLPERSTQAFSLHFRTAEPYRYLARAEEYVRTHLARNPFSTLQIVLETDGDFPFDVFERLRAACERDENIYLDRFYEFTPQTTAGAQRIVTLLPECARGRIDPEWLRDAERHTAIVWRPNAHSAGERGS